MVTENQKKPLSLHIPSCRWIPPKGECRDGKLKEKTNEREANDEGGLPLKGNVMKEKGISKLENLEISKFEK